MRRKFMVLLVLLVLLSACATYKTKMAEPPALANADNGNSEIDYQVFLIGDAGHIDEGRISPALVNLRSHLQKATKESAVLFLGDNVYPAGIPPRDDEGYADAERHLLAQLQILDGFEGEVLIIPGNHDWYSGLEGIKRQQKYVEDYLDEDAFQPEDGCAGPEIVEVTDDLVIFIIDSQWWLEDWDDDPYFNEECEIKTREDFIAQVTDELKKLKEKYVVFALHHPVFTNGPHGGHYSVKQHIFPLTMAGDNLYLPTPGVGSALLFLKNVIGVPQDVNHPKLRELTDQLLTIAADFPGVIFVSGHEHTLQLIREDDHWFVVSGSGSKQNPVRLTNNGIFASGQLGFSRLDFRGDGSVDIHFFEADSSVTGGRLVFSKRLFDKKPPIPDYEEIEYDIYDKAVDTLAFSVYERSFEHSKLSYALFGEYYRKYYDMDIPVPVLDLDTYKGGVKPVRRGGGFQTNSLRLEAKDGYQYAMRSIRKDVSRLLPQAFRNSFVTSILEDQFTSAHPYSAFVIPPMAEAVGIYHTKPELYFVPRQPALGIYNDQFGDQLYLLEDRPDENRERLDYFGNSEEIVSTSKMLEEIYEDGDHRIDPNAWVRARLFDLLINDWDRHEDQWRWATFRDGADKLFRPIPRDRDQAFSKFDGFFPKLLSLTAPVVRQMKGYDYEIRNVPIQYNARYIDRSLFPFASWEIWEEEVKHIQENLTDAVIDSSFRLWPEPIAADMAEEASAMMRSRRDGLLETARTFYEYLNKKVDIVGTNKHDVFHVIRQEDGATSINIFELSKSGNVKTLYYERTFFPGETKELVLYGLQGEDQFEIMGESSAKTMKIRIVGGLGEDIFIDRSSVSGPAKKTIIYDNLEVNYLELGKEAVDRRSSRRYMNLYDRKAFHFPYSLVLPNLGFNPDDGFLLGLALTHHTNGFKKLPYATSHTFSGMYAFSTSSYQFSYRGEFTELIGRLDLDLSLDYQGPLFAINFFGLGNESPYYEDKDFFRVRQSLLGATPLLRKRISGNGRLYFGPSWQNISIEKTEGRLISADGFVPERVFDRLNFVGGRIGFEYSNVDQVLNPTYGIDFKLEGSYTKGLNGSITDNPAFRTSVAFYQNLIEGGYFVLATQVGTEVNFGDFEFYQSATLGGHRNLRGYFRYRFSGNSSFYHNTDLRIKLASIRGLTLPFSLGVQGIFDYGRVWVDGSGSDDWHIGYGGGLWLSPFDLGILAANLVRGEDGNRFTFRFGFMF